MLILNAEYIIKIEIDLHIIGKVYYNQTMQFPTLQLNAEATIFVPSRPDAEDHCIESELVRLLDDDKPLSD